jgi:PPOX class probable F420-dependent enzyme
MKATAPAPDTTSITTPAGLFDRFVNQRNVLLTTYRRDGTPVGTPVHIAVVGSKAYIRTFDPSGKLERIRRNSEVEIAPSTIRGRVTGPAMRARARILDGDEAARAGRARRRSIPSYTAGSSPRTTAARGS